METFKFKIKQPLFARCESRLPNPLCYFIKFFSFTGTTVSLPNQSGQISYRFPLDNGLAVFLKENFI